MSRNIVLIGYRGTGKSTIARQLALALGWDWVDADVEIELRAGRSIAAIFADDGEPAFRELESAVVADLARRTRTVIALGGGAVLRPENRQRIAEAGRAIWLTAELDTILQRLRTDAATAQRRPRLTPLADAEEVERLLNERAPLYRECAELSVRTDGRSPAEIVGEIIARLGAVNE